MNYLSIWVLFCLFILFHSSDNFLMISIKNFVFYFYSNSHQIISKIGKSPTSKRFVESRSKCFATVKRKAIHGTDIFMVYIIFIRIWCSFAILPQIQLQLVYEWQCSLQQTTERILALNWTALEKPNQRHIYTAMKFRLVENCRTMLQTQK